MGADPKENLERRRFTTQVEGAIEYYIHATGHKAWAKT